MSFYALRSRFRTARRCVVAFIAAATYRFELRVWVVRPDVSRLHSMIPVLTVGDGVSREALHKVHFAEAAAWVLDEPESRLEFLDESDDVAVGCVALFGVVADWLERVAVLAAMVRYCCDTVCRAIWRCPDDVGDASAEFDDLLLPEAGDVCVECDVLELRVPLDRDGLPPLRSKALLMLRVPANNSRTLVVLPPCFSAVFIRRSSNL